MKTKTLLTVVLIAMIAVININSINAQSLKAKEWIADIKTNTIPEFQKKFKVLDSVYFSKIEITVDFSSFGSEDVELSYVMNQISNVYDAVTYLYNRSETAKNELQKQFKKISISFLKDESKRSVVFKSNEISITSQSFSYNYLTSTEIGDALEKGL